MDQDHLAHALQMMRENMEDPVLAFDYAHRVLEEGGHAEAFEFLIDYYSPGGQNPRRFWEIRYKNLYDEFQNRRGF